MLTVALCRYLDTDVYQEGLEAQWLSTPSQVTRVLNSQREGCFTGLLQTNAEAGGTRGCCQGISKEHDDQGCSLLPL